MGMSVPRRSTFPVDGAYISARTRISVLFPAPFGPIRPRRSPLPSVKLTCSSARTTEICDPLFTIFPPIERAFATATARSDRARIDKIGMSIVRFSTTILAIASNPKCNAAPKAHIHERPRNQRRCGKANGDRPGLDFHRPSQDRIPYNHQHIGHGVEFED